MIQIHDSKKKGDYSVRVVQRNGKITSDNSGFSSELAVVKNIISNANSYRTMGSTLWKEKSIHRGVRALFDFLDIRDHTKAQYFAQKYGCKKGKDTTKAKLFKQIK